MSAFDLGQDRLWLGGADEWLGCLVVLGEVAIDRGLQVDKSRSRSTPRCRRRRGSLAKKPSDAGLGFAGAAHDLDRPQALGPEQDDLGPPDVFLQTVPIGRDRRQTRTIGR